LSSVLTIFESTLAVWRPEVQSIFLRHQYQRYVYAISEDEAFLSKNHDKSTGGVFGEGGTAGSVVSGVSRRDTNLMPKWSGWLTELRNTCFQLIGIFVSERAMFAPEISTQYPRFVSVIANPDYLRCMEHRHLTQYLKHVVELMLVCCPATLYTTHLAPIIGTVMEHIRYRLELTWSPVVASNGASNSTQALTSSNATAAAGLAARGGDEWFKWYYAHAGLFVGDLDAVTAEAAVEKHRVDLSRAFSDMLQTALALKGPWALVLANIAKEEQAAKGGDSLSGLASQSSTSADLNANGNVKTPGQSHVQARKLGRIHGICNFLLLENPTIAWNMISTVIQCLGYPDAYTVRRMTKVCHRILETVAWSPQYTNILGEHMFQQAIRNIVFEPKWMVGIEWDMINVVRDIYCRLVLGQMLLAGGQGPGIQMNCIGGNSNNYEQSKTVDRPLQGGGILTVASDAPRRVLASIPGISVQFVENLERDMKTKRSAKDQKDFLRDLLRIASDNVRNVVPDTTTGGIFTRADEAESLLHTRNRVPVIPSLPEKLVTQSQIEKARQKKLHAQEEPQDLSNFFNS
jgi:exportin-5